MRGQLTSCCCCFSLRTGSMIIGIMGLVYSIFIVAICSSVLADPDAVVRPLLPREEREFKSIAEWLEEIDRIEEIDRKKNELYDSMFRIVVTVNVVCVCFGVLDCIMCILLISGAAIRYPRLVRPWVWWTSISEAMGILVAIISIILMHRLNVTHSTSSYMRFIVSACSGVYYILVVNSYHTQLVTGNAERLPEGPPSDASGGRTAPRRAAAAAAGRNSAEPNPC